MDTFFESLKKREFFCFIFHQLSHLTSSRFLIYNIVSILVSIKYHKVIKGLTSVFSHISWLTSLINVVSGSWGKLEGNPPYNLYGYVWHGD